MWTGDLGELATGLKVNSHPNVDVFIIQNGKE